MWFAMNKNFVMVRTLQSGDKTGTFIAALFIIAPTWNQPKCPSADDQVNKMWYIHTVENYLAIKESTDTCYNMDEP